MGMWRNGRRARFRSVCPKGRGGSTPPIPTRWRGPLSAEIADRGPLVISSPGAEPPEAPHHGEWRSLTTRGNPFPVVAFAWS